MCYTAWKTKLCALPKSQRMYMKNVWLQLNKWCRRLASTNKRTIVFIIILEYYWYYYFFLFYEKITIFYHLTKKNVKKNRNCCSCDYKNLRQPIYKDLSIHVKKEPRLGSVFIRQGSGNTLPLHESNICVIRPRPAHKLATEVSS